MQLQQVIDALRISKSDTERSSLKNLHSDLTELLQLTRETLQEHQTPNTDPFADEMSLFMAEIGNEVDPSPSATSTSNKRLQSIKVNIIYFFIKYMLTRSCKFSGFYELKLFSNWFDN